MRACLLACLLLLGSHHGVYENDFISRSDDGGLTWVTNAQVLPKMNEGALTQLPNGSVLANMRHQVGRQQV